MKFVFLCGSLEPGRDGIGDYTRKLADELSRQNHKVAMIALYDDYLTEEIIESTHGSGKQSVHTLRLSTKLVWKNKLTKIIELIEIINPDWISLQYNPYSFQKRGVPVKLTTHLMEIKGNYKWHIMFHETWVGIKHDSPLTHIIYGFLQKKIIRYLVDKLKPNYISTNNVIYQLALRKEKIDAKILSLFSNISLLPKDDLFLSEIYKNLNISFLEIADYYILGFFGNIYHSNKIKEVVNDEIKLAEVKKKKVILMLFGRIGNIEKYEYIKTIFIDKIKIVYLGELTELQISSILQILNKGMLGTPKEYFSKSGVYAAMKLHNLEVISASTLLLSRYTEEARVFNIYLEKREHYKWDVRYIAKQFYEKLLYSHCES